MYKKKQKKKRKKNDNDDDVDEEEEKGESDVDLTLKKITKYINRTFYSFNYVPNNFCKLKFYPKMSKKSHSHLRPFIFIVTIVK